MYTGLNSAPPSRKKLCTVILLTLLSFVMEAGVVSAQTYKEFSGYIVEADSELPIEQATIILPELSIWCISDQSGSFKFANLKPGTYKFIVSFLGYQDFKGTVTISSSGADKPFKIILEPATLALDNVIVTAQEERMGSTSKIEKAAIQHIQPKSLEDLLQLVPGNITSNPNLFSAGQAHVRDIEGTDNNALGMSIIVDGAPVSNDANMQTMSTSYSGNRLNNTGSGKSQTVVGRGVDLRSISTENLTSIEVIRGIAPAEYGNITSGAMIVKTRAGYAPYEAKFQTDAHSKMVSASKGFNLGSNNGALNFSVDYSSSITDIRRAYQGFNRITANLGYSNTFLASTKPLSFNVKAAFYRNMNEEKSDPQLKKNEKIVNRHYGLRLNIEGDWSLNNAIISTLSYSFMGSYTDQYDYEYRFVSTSSGIIPIGTSMVDATYSAPFLNSSYYAAHTIEGKQIDFYGQIKALKNIRFGKRSFNNIKAGVDWTYNKNNGDGLQFDLLKPPHAGGNQSLRPRSNKEIPAMNNLGAFVEDKLMLGMGHMGLTVQAGVRFTNMFLKEYAGMRRDNYFIVEPRFNGEFNILNKNNNSFLDDFSITGGWGISAKTPTLGQLYPHRAYLDAVGLNYLKVNDGNYDGSLAVLTTKVINDTSDPQLKPMKARKAEIGFSFKKGQISGMVTYFNEKHTNTYGYVSVPVIMEYQKFNPLPSGSTNVRYGDGKVYYSTAEGEQELGSETKKLFYSYQQPTNTGQLDKQGVEYSINFGQLKALKTSLTIDGAWIRIRSRAVKDSYSILSSTYNGEVYPYAPLFMGGSGTVSERINTNFRFVTHIPRLRMIFSTTLQAVWTNRTWDIYEDNDGNDLLREAENGKLYTNPVGFLDKEGNFNAWKPEYNSLAPYSSMVNYMGENYRAQEAYPVDIILNFRLTKEFGDHMSLSFIANNFLNMKKYYKMAKAAGYVNITLPIYYGAELTIKF